MISFSFLFDAVVVLLFTASSAEAASMHKCIMNGVATYQQGPCQSDQTRKRPTLEELNGEEKKRRAAAAAASPQRTTPANPAPAAVSTGFRCDGRQHCSQMTSCAEAKYFLSHCPGVEMDGDKDGTPCEQQWCSR